MTLAEQPKAAFGEFVSDHRRTLMAREATNTIVTRADPDCSIISAFACRVSGIVSVGLKAVEFVKLV